jgi:uncharacterized protein with HEPN domain
MSRSIIDYFNHIRDELIFLKEDSNKYSFELFCNDKKTVLSYTRSLEIIGEACKNVPAEYRTKYPQIDWKGFAGLRDIIIHQYFGIDYEAIWDTITNEIPEMLLEIERIIEFESR